MNIYSFASLLASLFCIVLGGFVFVKKQNDRKCKFFGIASILTGLWTLFPFVLSRAANDSSALILARLTYIPAVFTAPAWLHFVFSAINEKLSVREKRRLALIYSLSVPFIFIIPSPLFIAGTKRFVPHFAVVPGPLFILFVAVFGMIFIYILKTAFYGFKNASGYYRNQLKFILVSFIFGFLSGGIHFSTAYFHKEIFPHDFLLIGYTGLIAYSILKHRLMDLTVTITRTSIFVAVYTLVLGLPLLLITLAKGRLINLFGVNWWMAPLSLTMVLAGVGPFFYIYLQKQAEAILLREQRRYQRTLKEAAKEIARIHNLKKLLSLIVHIVTRAVRISHSEIYLFETGKQKFCLKASRNFKGNQVFLINEDNPLIIWLKSYEEPLVYEEVVRKAQEGQSPVFKKLEREMRSLNAALIVPGLIEGNLLGFLVLGNKDSGKIYTSDDLNTFSVLANQTALAVENALLYESIEEQVRQRTKELIEVQKQLVQAEKLATMGTLAGGVAHEINNPLTAILTNVQMLLATIPKDSDLDRESLELIEEATKRCRTIVQKLMAYAKKPMEAGEVKEVDLLGIVKSVATFLNYQLEQDNIKLNIRASKDGYLVMGNNNELEQVITNLILNARDAVKQAKNAGEIYITLNKNDNWVKMEVRDEGSGIPKEIITKIFDPFFTTKDIGKGLGLGLSICHSIIEKHGGMITVQSEPDKGAVFTVQLPYYAKLGNNAKGGVRGR